MLQRACSGVVWYRGEKRTEEDRDRRRERRRGRGKESVRKEKEKCKKIGKAKETEGNTTVNMWHGGAEKFQRHSVKEQPWIILTVNQGGASLRHWKLLKTIRASSHQRKKTGTSYSRPSFMTWTSPSGCKEISTETSKKKQKMWMADPFSKVMRTCTEERSCWPRREDWTCLNRNCSFIWLLLFCSTAETFIWDLDFGFIFFFYNCSKRFSFILKRLG